MRIVDYELFKVPPRWMFLKLTTSDGTVGWGEPVLEGRVDTVRTEVEALLDDFILNNNPLNIESHWQDMYRGGYYRGGPIIMSAISGIDQALWDIKGKSLGAPVHELLGGRVRDRIQAYQWIGGDNPTDVKDAALEQLKHGFSAFKMNATGKLKPIDTLSQVQQVSERFKEVRNAVGSDVDIALDFHGRVHKPMAKQVARALEEYQPMFIEEPVLAEYNGWLPHLAQNTTIPIATGERMYSRWDFKQVLESGAVDVVQPDLSHAGGISEVRKIATMAEAYDVSLAPHCPLGPIALASCIQIDACSPNALIQEHSLNIHYNLEWDVLDYLNKPETLNIDNGFIEISADPGLGIEIDEKSVQKASHDDIKWNVPMWRYEDGSLAEW